MSNSKYLFFITGSIAAFKAAQVISRLVKDGNEVRCVATPSALKFVGSATFEGLTGHPVTTDLWEAGKAMDHIHLSRWCDAGVVCPASANTIAQMALGLAPDLTSSTLLAWPKNKPLHVFPAMNVEMYNAEITQQHMRTLSGRGVVVHPSGSGELACGETGEGRLLEPNEVIERISNGGLTQRRDRIDNTSASKKILITGGATRENIDGIRFISNVSTGKTAAQLCERFALAGWHVTYLHGEQAAKPRAVTTDFVFSDVANLNDNLRRELSTQEYAAVIHCAAVSDFTVDNINGAAPETEGKISSTEALTLSLKPTPKLLPNLKEYSRNKNLRVVGFKLLNNSSNEDLHQAAEKVLKSGADAVVANDWAQITSNRDRHSGFVLTKAGEKTFGSVDQMANLLIEFLSIKEVL